MAGLRLSAIKKWRATPVLPPASLQLQAISHCMRAGFRWSSPPSGTCIRVSRKRKGVCFFSKALRLRHTSKGERRRFRPPFPTKEDRQERWSHFSPWREVSYEHSRHCAPDSYSGRTPARSAARSQLAAAHPATSFEEGLPRTGFRLNPESRRARTARRNCFTCKSRFSRKPRW